MNQLRLARALRAWASADEVVNRSEYRVLLPDYERAVTVVVAMLQGDTSLAALLRRYVQDPNLAAQCDAARKEVPDGWRLSPSLIRDSSFWRRSQELRDSPATDPGKN